MIYKYDKNKLTFKNATLTVAFLFLIPVLMSFVYVNLNNNIQTKYIITETEITLLNKQNEFSEEKLKKYLLELNIKYPDIVLAQAKIESGNFTSKIFIENHNLFGMKEAKLRPTTNKGTQYNHAYYNNWRESVIDYALWQSKYTSTLTKQEYLNFLSKYYAEDSLYVTKIKTFINN